MTHLGRVVVATCEKILALHLLAVMAEAITRGCHVRVLLGQTSVVVARNQDVTWGARLR